LVVVEERTAPQDAKDVRAEAAPARDVVHPLLERITTVALCIASGVTVSSVVLLAVAHVSDRYAVNHASGTWMALAQDAHNGHLYRPLFDNGVFGGTWYMPLQIVLHTALSFVTGEYLVSGKLLAYAVAVALCTLLFAILRREGCGWALSLGLVSSILATQTGVLAVEGIRGDALPVLLQLAAVALAARAASSREFAAAGAICALAVTSKASAIWAPAAILLWLLVRDRRRALAFAAAAGGSLVVLLAAFEAASSGRLSDNVIGLTRSGGSSSSLSAGASTFLDLMSSRAGATWLLLPFALVAVALAASRRRLTLYQLAFLIEIPIVIVVLADPGSDYNHLLDLSVLTALVVGQFVAGRWSPTGAALAFAVSIALVLGITDSYRAAIKPSIGEAVDELRGTGSDLYTTKPLAGYVQRGDTVLSEDPSLLVLLHERPLLIDGISLRRLGFSHPQWTAALRRRLDRRAFDEVVLLHPIEAADWYRDATLGAEIRDGIRDNYRLKAMLDRPPLAYWVYVPRKLRAEVGDAAAP
jgi:hypothetical protein